MNELEGRLEYVFNETLPNFGSAIEVTPGVFWLRMPLPISLDHVNVWLMRDNVDGMDGWTIVDCGISDDDTKTHWEHVFDTLLDGMPVLRVIVTHYHPDHLGLADWVCRGGAKGRWNVRLWASQGEYAMGRLLLAADSSNTEGERAARHCALNGLKDQESLDALRARVRYYRMLVPTVPLSYRRLQGGDHVSINGYAWKVIVGFGYSPEHCAFFCEERRVLISGDMVLPRISTNISVLDMEPEGNSLALYLGSLDCYGMLSTDTLVLPSHGKPFRGMHTRIDQLRAHHAARLGEIMEACGRSPHSAADIVPIMFKRKLDVHQLSFALAEALAHLHLLWFKEKLVRREEADGVIRFSLAPVG